MEQRCKDAALACPECNGFGRIVKGFGTSMAEIEAMIAAGLGDRPIDTAEVECKACAGTGRRMPKREKS